jgi:acyl-CoA reductase-like NAD-dependent aldehyde dehydrogenase
MANLIVKNPYSGETIQELPFATKEDAKRVFARAHDAFATWKKSMAWERSELLLAVANEIERNRNDFALTMAREAGKPITLAQGEVDRALSVLRWASGETQRFAGELLRLDAARSGRAGFGIVERFPRGVILGITPFNFPLNLVIHKIAPAVASGCAIVIKPSPATPLTTLKLVEIFEKLRPGLVQGIVADDALTEELTRSKEISMVSFTGSARIGKLIQQQAYDKPVVLELGGNAWVIVMEDVPSSAYPAIAKKISGGAYGYAGQSCISVQNVAVASAIWNDVQKLLKETTQNFAFGAPETAEVLSGPVINEAASRRVRAEISRASGGSGTKSAALGEVVRSTKTYGNVQEGAGNLIGPSLILPSTAITSVPGEFQSLQQEEIFAPVMMAGKFDRVDDLIRTINSSPYGLQAGVFTQNLGVIEKLYRELDVGGLVVNDVPTTRYDHQPYGGVKDSGHGREGVRYAMEEMTYTKFLNLSSQFPT